MKIIDPYPTTELVSPVISPLVAYFSNSPFVAPRAILPGLMVNYGDAPSGITHNPETED